MYTTENCNIPAEVVPATATTTTTAVEAATGGTEGLLRWASETGIVVAGATHGSRVGAKMGRNIGAASTTAAAACLWLTSCQHKKIYHRVDG